MGWLTTITSMFKPLSDIYTARQERKVATESLKTKVALQQDTNNKDITLSDAEWEVVKASSEPSSWKDEYVTILVTSPYVLIVIGSVWLVCFSDPSLLNSGVHAIATMNEVGIDINFLMQAVVLAAIGLKMWRK